MTTAVAAPPSRSALRTAVGWALAAVALGYVLWVVPFDDTCVGADCTPGLWSLLGAARWGYVALAVALYVGSTFVWSLRWRALLGLADVRITPREAWLVTLEAQTGGILLPGGIGGDALRVAFVRERAREADLAKIVASIFVDRVVGLSTLAALATAFAVVSGPGDLGPAVGFLAAIPVGAVAAFGVVRIPFLRRTGLFGRGLLARVFDPMLAYAADPRGPWVLMRGVALSGVVSALQLVVIRVLLIALSSDPTSESGVFVGATFGMIVTAIPSTPGAWGTADAAYVLFLGRAGVLPAAAAGVCLLYRMCWYTSGLLGAASAIARRPG